VCAFKFVFYTLSHLRTVLFYSSFIGTEYGRASSHQCAVFAYNGSTIAIRNHYRVILRTLKARSWASLDRADKKNEVRRRSRVEFHRTRARHDNFICWPVTWPLNRTPANIRRQLLYLSTRPIVRSEKTPSEVVSCCPVQRPCKPKLPSVPCVYLSSADLRGTPAFSSTCCDLCRPGRNRTPRIWARTVREYPPARPRVEWPVRPQSSRTVIDPGVSDAHLRPKIKDGKQGARCGHLYSGPRARRWVGGPRCRDVRTDCF